MDAVSSNDRVGSPKKTKFTIEIEITKITLQLAGDLRLFCAQKWVWYMGVTI
jgi:hypothetical protein